MGELGLTYQPPQVLDDLRRYHIACRKISLAIRRAYGLQVDPRAIRVIGEKVFGLSPYQADTAIQRFQEEYFVR